MFAIVFLSFRNHTNCFLLLLKSLASAKKAIAKNYLPFITKFLIALNILKCTKKSLKPHTDHFLEINCSRESVQIRQAIFYFVLCTTGIKLPNQALP